MWCSYISCAGLHSDLHYVITSSKKILLEIQQQENFQLPLQDPLNYKVTTIENIPVGVSGSGSRLPPGSVYVSWCAKCWTEKYYLSHISLFLSGKRPSFTTDLERFEPSQAGKTYEYTDPPTENSGAVSGGRQAEYLPCLSPKSHNHIPNQWKFQAPWL